MATEQAGIISGDESEIHDEPHVERRQITVRYIQARVEEWGLRPETLADRHGLDHADVYAALAYYHNHPEEMREVAERHERAVKVAQDRTTLTRRRSRDWSTGYQPPF